MNIRPLQNRDIDTLHALYGSVTTSVVHGFPPTRDEFADALRSTPANLADSAVLVVERGREPLGFARIGLHVPTERWSMAERGQGMLIGPFVLRANREAGQLLLEIALSELKARGAASICAFDPGEG